MTQLRIPRQLHDEHGGSSLMRSRQLNIPIILLLVVPLGRVPLPWVHRHEQLNQPQLTVHINESHSGDLDDCEQTDWHLHLLYIGTEEASSLSDSVKKEQEVTKALAGPCYTSTSIAASSLHHREPFCGFHDSVDLYQRHCSLLL